jgi:hypothetical protein
MPETRVAEKSLTMTEIRIKAKGLGINPGKTNKTELIRTVQAAEGYSPCYGKSNGQCPYTDCCFRADCLKIRL